MNNLQHMYQAWRQGNEDYVRDWAFFVELAARENNTSCDRVMDELKKYHWFEWRREE